jgi:hypothetical protein
MLFETKNESISILYGRHSHDPLDTNMLPSTMLNLFRCALTPQCPEIILETVVISFFSALHSSNHDLRETLGKMKCENFSVSATLQLFCHSSKILCFASGSKSRATDPSSYGGKSCMFVQPKPRKANRIKRLCTCFTLSTRAS